jgi:quercetin dioxygenase-like cupin family protein
VTLGHNQLFLARLACSVRPIGFRLIWEVRCAYCCSGGGYKDKTGYGRRKRDLETDSDIEADGTPTFSFRVFTIEPGGHTPLHSHPFEHLNYVIDGNGVVVAEGEEDVLKKGDFVLLLPDETHQSLN